MFRACRSPLACEVMGVFIGIKPMEEWPTMAKQNTQKREDESQTAFTLRCLLNDQAEECAKIAEAVGKVLGEPAIGHAIAKAIRERVTK